MKNQIKYINQLETIKYYIMKNDLKMVEAKLEALILEITKKDIKNERNR